MNISAESLEISENILRSKFDVTEKYQTLSDSSKAEVCIYISSVIFGQQSSFWRAKIIESSIAIEMNLAQLLTAYFVDEKSAKFPILNSSIFDRMSLSSKIKHITEILSRHHPLLFKKYSDNISNISKLIKLRNELAHSLLTVTEEHFTKHTKHTETVLSKRKNISELEYFYISFYDKDEFKTKKILFLDVIKASEDLLKENEVIIKIKNELINLDTHK